MLATRYKNKKSNNRHINRDKIFAAMQEYTIHKNNLIEGHNFDRCL